MRKILALLAVVYLLLATASSVSAGGGPTPPDNWCATNLREYNVPWQIVNHPEKIQNPGCDESNTQYAITINGNPAIRGGWDKLEELRDGGNATYYNEWASTAPPDGWCATGPGRGENPPWQVVNISSVIPDPLCGPNTIYAITSDSLNNGNVAVYSYDWSELEQMRGKHNATFYNEWRGEATPSASPTPEATPSPVETDTPLPTAVPSEAPTTMPSAVPTDVSTASPTATPMAIAPQQAAQNTSNLVIPALVVFAIVLVVGSLLVLGIRQRRP